MTKDKKVKQDKPVLEAVPMPPIPQQVVPPAVKVELVERLVDADKSVLDLAKARRETALEKAKTALAQSEVSELAYNNVILQLAIRYHLVDGDIINDDGSIKRKQ
jgi:hypothetical protein